VVVTTKNKKRRLRIFKYLARLTSLLQPSCSLHEASELDCLVGVSTSTLETEINIVELFLNELQCRLELLESGKS